MRIYIDTEVKSSEIYRYVFELISFNKNLDLKIVESRSESDLVVSYNSDDHITLSRQFAENLHEQKFSHFEYFSKDCYIRNDSGDIDFISTIFYCINSIQENNAPSDDFLNRFQYKNSYQKQFDNIKINHVQNCIDEVVKKINLPTDFKRKSGFFLSHDIDSVYGSLLEDGMFLLKHGKLGDLFGVVLRHLSGKADWKNFDRIMNIESEYDFKSVFYWLLKKDKMNSDYNFQSAAIQKEYKAIKFRQWESALHKSIDNATLDQEYARMNEDLKSNRFHYLNFTLPDGYNKLNESSVLIDSSLGFTEMSGYRNNYGLPFVPFDLSNKRTYDFLEVPMHIMDRTFFRDKKNVDNVGDDLINWFEANKFNSVFCLNFHNNFFSDFKYGGYVKLYRRLLGYFRETGFQNMSLKSLNDDYYLPLSLIHKS